MIIIDILKDYLKVLQIKTVIENDLINKDIEKEEDKKELTVEEFVNFLNLSGTIYVSGETIIPFRYIKTSNNTYLFYSETSENKLLSILLNALNNIKFNFERLTKLDYISIVSKGLENTPHFIINGELYYDLNN